MMKNCHDYYDEDNVTDDDKQKLWHHKPSFPLVESHKNLPLSSSFPLLFSLSIHCFKKKKKKKKCNSQAKENFVVNKNKLITTHVVVTEIRA